MSDWLNKLEKEKESEERERKQKEEERLKPSRVGYENNKALVDDIYNRITTQVERAKKAGGFGLEIERYKSTQDFNVMTSETTLPENSIWSDDGIDNGYRPVRTLRLNIDYNNFKVTFNSYIPSAYVVKNMPIRSVDEEYISFLVKWIATGEPKLEERPKEGFFNSKLLKKLVSIMAALVWCAFLFFYISLRSPFQVDYEQRIADSSWWLLTTLIGVCILTSILVFYIVQFFYEPNRHNRWDYFVGIVKYSILSGVVMIAFYYSADYSNELKEFLVLGILLILTSLVIRRIKV
jgi:hypothetical protein